MAGLTAALRDPRRIAALAGAGAAAALLAAFWFQYVDGLRPCPLCIWQRWPHAAAAALGLGALAAPRWALGLALALGAAVSLAGAGVALFHAGVEQGWWSGLESCAGPGDIGGMSTADLIARIEAAPLARCDEIPWSFLGLSMAAWNVPLSLGLAGLFGLSLWRLQVTRARA